MMELTTGVVFLMSSLYGSVQADNHVRTMNAQIPADASVAATTEVRTFTNDTKGMEAYLRAAYADEPVLVDIARCESEFRQYDSSGIIIRGRVDKDDLGVMQINSRYQGSTALKLGYDLYTLEGNVGYAKHLYEEQGTKPWSASEPCWGRALAKK